MNNSKYRFTLDMHSTISQVSLPLRENDAGVELRITLTDGGTPYFIADGCRAVFCARKSDDKYLLNDCIIEKNTTIYYKLTQQTTAAKGVVDCEIRVYGIDNNLLTSPKFILVVSDRVWHDSDFPMSDTEKHAIDKIFANETSRQDAEALRVIAEEEREKTYQEMLDTVKEASDAADILTEKIATGDYNGLTPYIGANGNWWIGEEDTGVLADGFSIPLRTGSGENSVEQIGCEATAKNAVALGKGTKATADGQTAGGEFNKENPDAHFVVGNGTSDTDRSNAFEVLKDGSVVISNDNRQVIETGTILPVITSHRVGNPTNDTETRATIEIPLGIKPRVVYLVNNDNSILGCYIGDEAHKKDRENCALISNCEENIFRLRLIEYYESGMTPFQKELKFVAFGNASEPNAKNNTFTLHDIDGVVLGVYEIKSNGSTLVMRMIKQLKNPSGDTYYFLYTYDIELDGKVVYTASVKRDYTDTRIWNCGLATTKDGNVVSRYIEGETTISLQGGKNHSYYMVTEYVG